MRPNLHRTYAALQNPVQKLLGVIFFAIGILLIIIGLILFSNFGGNWSEIFNFSNPVHSLPFFIPSLTGTIFIIIGGIMWYLHGRRLRLLEILLQTGRREEAVVISNLQNYNFRVNGVPQRKVIFETQSGETLTYTFFSEPLAEFLPRGAKLFVRYNEKGKVVPDPSFFEET